ncbi:GAF domain-containing protein [Nonomuraea zeae]|uniref:GAF domain-containing protein n=1 Tax=Nonomuraea zeae TaxID=1642303 RepID=A0A5S4G9W0_9ACTN|nr:GAF domain-containing protein [Nonomuraea zeae]TMR29652.1 GAF domain-containing protein [Nonomuraea zeae]
MMDILEPAHPPREQPPPSRAFHRMPGTRGSSLRVFLDPGLGLSSDRQRVAETTLDAAIELADADMGNVQLTDPEAGGLRIAAQRGFGEPFLRFFEVVRDEDGSVCGRAMKQIAPMMVRDVALDPDLAGTPTLRILLGAGVRTVHSTPLLDETGTMLGMLSVHYREVRQFAEVSQRLMWPLARRAGRLLRACPPG